MASKDPDVRELQANVRNILSNIDDLKEQIKIGFKGVHKRQDVTNGKVVKNADRIDALERELLEHETHVAEENADNFRRIIRDNKDKLWAVGMVLFTLFVTYMWNKIL